MTLGILDLFGIVLYAAVVLGVGLRDGRTASSAYGYTEIFTLKKL